MNFLIVTIAGVTLYSVEPLTDQACNTIKQTMANAICVAEEPPCGKGTPRKCKGKVRP
jgi:hypothetical protein